MKFKKLSSHVFICIIILALSIVGIQGNKVFADGLPTLLQLDSNIEGTTLTGTTSISGWSISASGIQKLEISVDGSAKEQMVYGSSRPDILAAYPNYQQSSNSGFNYNLNTRKYSNGNHVITIIATSIDGTTFQNQWHISITNIQTPIMGQAIATKNQMIQYFLNNNDAKDYSYINNFVGIVLDEASVEGVRGDMAFAQMMKETNFLKFTGDVSEAQNNFAGIGATGGGAAGASFPDIRTGIRAVIQHLKAYATKDPLKLPVVDPRYSLVTKASAPYFEWLGKNENPNGYGWATGLNYGCDIVARFNNIKAIVIQPSTAVISSFNIPSDFEPGDSYTINGYATSGNRALYQFSVKDYSTNSWTLVQDYSENGNLVWNPTKAGQYRIKLNIKDIFSSKDCDNSIYKDVIVTTNFTEISNISGKTIVVDPGHNYGGDDGAYGKFTDVTYSERDLNMQMGLKLKSELEKLGANVILTRQASDRSTDPATVSLQKRVDIANNANADLFISLHHDSSSSASTAGISTHYSTYKPGIDTSGIDTNGNDPSGWYYGVNIDNTPSNAAIISRNLATKLANELSSSLGYNNLLAHDHNLFVTVNTNIPAVLIEEGFLTNQTEAQRCADPNEQQEKAQKIAQIINDYYGS